MNFVKAVWRGGGKRSGEKIKKGATLFLYLSVFYNVSKTIRTILCDALKRLFMPVCGKDVSCINGKKGNIIYTFGCFKCAFIH